MIRCIKFRPYAKNTLADLELSRVGLILRDCTWREKKGKEWVAFLARSYQDKDFNKLWAPLIEFAEGAKHAREQFQHQAVAAIRPAAQQGEAVP
jgi:hypothetical protein